MKLIYTGDFLESLSQKQRMAYFFGCPERYLYLAEDDYASADSFKIHKFSDIYVRDAASEKGYEITSQNQFKNIDSVLNKALLRNPSDLIIINSRYLNSKEKSGSLFLYHLICALANKRLKTYDTNLDVQILSSIEDITPSNLELKMKTVLSYGIITNEMAAWEYNKAIQFLFTYENFTRILFCSVDDVGKLLSEHLRIEITYPEYIFNLGDINDMVAPAESKKRGKKEVKVKELKSIEV